MKNAFRFVVGLIVALGMLVGLSVLAPAKASPRGPIGNDYVLALNTGWNTPCNCDRDSGYLIFDPDTAVNHDWALKIRNKCTDGSAEGGYASEQTFVQIERYLGGSYGLWWANDDDPFYQDTTVGGEVDYYAYFHTPVAVKFRLLAWAHTNGYPPAYNPAECKYAAQIWKKTNTKHNAHDWWWRHGR